LRKYINRGWVRPGVPLFDGTSKRQFNCMMHGGRFCIVGSDSQELELDEVVI